MRLVRPLHQHSEVIGVCRQAEQPVLFFSFSFFFVCLRPNKYPGTAIGALKER